MIRSLFALALLSTRLFAMDVDLKSEFAILINLDNQRVLYEKNADCRAAPASVTKIATALYALKEVGEDLDVVIEADQDCIGSITAAMQKNMNYNHPPHWQVIGGTHMCIGKGDKNTLEDLLWGLLMVSANDAANVIAKYVAGTIPQFVSDMNDYLEELGCTNTHFRNPHGLCFPKHYTSARDLALITTEAFKYPLFRKIVATEKKGSFKNSNDLVQSHSYQHYPHAIGVKIGRHSEAGYNLVAAAEHEGRTLIAVLMGAKNEGEDYQDARVLFNNAFSEKPVEEVYLEKGEQRFRYKMEGIKKPLRTYLDETVTMQYYPSEKPCVKGSIHWHPPALPIQKGDIVADLTLTDERGDVLKEVPLFALEKVRAPRHISMSKIFLWGLSALLLLIALPKLFKRFV